MSLAVDASLIVATRYQCAVCQKATLEPLIRLPGLPLTERFSKTPCVHIPPGIDQAFLFCPSCYHGQLAYQVDPKELYHEHYSFRTSLSSKARLGTDFFLNVLYNLAGERVFDCVVDVGCNDLYLLHQLSPRAKMRVGIDPILKDKVKETTNKDILIIGDFVENVDLKTMGIKAPDLIVCRHTLEHIFDPRSLIERLLSWGDDNTIFLFEFPGLETLIGRQRFDQIFHQHLHYFSLFSFLKLIESLGAEYLGHAENQHDWGALCIGFRRISTQTLSAKAEIILKQPFSIQDIQQRYQLFQNHLACVGRLLSLFDRESLYGYGAANMLAVLAYHLKNDLSSFKNILDDDLTKDGWSYWNLPVSIIHSNKISLSNVSVCVTAVDNVQPIMTRLMRERPVNVVYPLPMM